VDQRGCIAHEVVTDRLSIHNRPKRANPDPIPAVAPHFG
jgi:hypothetical protein